MFHGSIVALVTPMQHNGEIDWPGLERLVDFHLNNLTDGILVLGTTGEPPTIMPTERDAIIEKVIIQVNGKIPVIVGTGANSTKKTIDLTTQAMELGADAALLVTPYYNKPTQEGLFQHYRSIAKAVPIPQILYNVPSRTGCDLLVPTVERLASIANIIALKEATGDLTRLEQLLALKMDIDLFSGDDGTAMEFILKGGKGVVSVAANVAPKEMHLMVEAALSGERIQAQNWNDKLQGLYQALMIESNPIPTKWALTQMKMIEDGIRLPLTPLNSDHYELVRAALQKASL